MKQSDEFFLNGKPILKKINYTINEEKINTLDPRKIPITIKIKKKIEKNKVQIYMTIYLFENQKDAPLYFEATLIGNFSWNNKLNENKKLLSIYINRNGPTIIYTYIRPIIRPILSILGAESNIGSIIFPIINFSEKEKNQEK